ncbi:MAG: AAA family ATPase [Deltaproteobacteria bacterium]|nr:AAA family ATPase [Deltaproteobacteria bacterium]
MNSSHYNKTKHLIPKVPDDQYARILIHPAQPSLVSDEQFVGRIEELDLLRIVLGLDNRWQPSPPTNSRLAGCPRVRLEGTSGRGKRSLVFELARRMGLPLYEIQGHADMSPEDMILAIVPRASTKNDLNPRFCLQASPLATALLWGGIVYFDALHRAPEKALAPLASLLDDRTTLKTY